jgi:K+-sensing histidine kinase KdpD
MAILGSLELLRKRLPDDRKSVALLENAAQGAQRGTALTKRMLAFARNYELTMEAIDVPELVHGMKELLERSIGPSFNIETRFPLSLKPVEADANQLELALLNLSLNARDAMPDGGDIVLAAREENIHAGHRSGLEAGRYICLSVTNTGEGMDQETLCKSHEENPLAVTAVPNLLSEGTRRIGWLLGLSLPKIKSVGIDGAALDRFGSFDDAKAMSALTLIADIERQPFDVR